MTFDKHLLDMKWLFYERGMQHVYNWLRQVANGTLGATALTTVGALDCDAVANPGFSAGQVPTNTINPSGQLNTVSSTNLEYGAGAVAKTPPTLTR
jgi:hypothetical protein